VISDCSKGSDYYYPHPESVACCEGLLKGCEYSLLPSDLQLLVITSIVPVLTLRVTLSTKLILSNLKYLANSALSKLYS
jgi:hypothetical protein